MRFDELPLCDAVMDGLQAMNFKGRRQGQPGSPA